MDVGVNKISQVAEARLFGSGMNDDFGRAIFSDCFFDESGRVGRRKIDRDRSTCGRAVTPRQTGDVMFLCGQMTGQPCTQEPTTARYPDIHFFNSHKKAQKAQKEF